MLSSCEVLSMSGLVAGPPQNATLGHFRQAWDIITLCLSLPSSPTIERAMPKQLITQRAVCEEETLSSLKPMPTHGPVHAWLEP